MKKIFILFLIFFLSKQLYAQPALKGTVSDRKNNLPLANVTVFIPELQKGTLTGADGIFSLETPSAGIVNVQFTMIGYKSQVKTINLGNETADLKIEMESSATELEEVVVTSNNVKLPDNIPYPVNAVSKEELDNTAGLTLMSKLSYEPGIDRISVGTGIGKPVIRGNSFNRILLYAMGTRIENQQWDDRHDLGISENGLEKVEVINGPAALIYGADALGGALIFVDEKPAATGKWAADAAIGGNVNNIGSYFDLGYKSTKTTGLFYILRAGGHGNGSYIQGGDKPDSVLFKRNYAANSKFIDLTGKGAIGLSKKWGVSKLSYSFMNQRTGIVELEPDSILLIEPEGEQMTYDVEAPYQDVTSHIVSSENTFLMKHSKVNANVAYQLNNRKEFEPTGVKKGKDLAFGLKLNVITYDVKWTSDAEKKFGFTIGTQGMLQKNENFGKEALVPDADVKDFAGYLLARYDFEKINILGGIRYDMRKIEAESPAGEEEEEDSLEMKPEIDFENEYKPISGSLGIAVHLSKEFTIKLNGATGFSAPNYAELGTFGRHEGTYRFEVGNPGLKMEQNVEGDLGLIWENEFASINISGFYNMIKDYIYLSPSADTIDDLQVYDFLQHDATISGGSAGFDIHPFDLKWLDLKADYSVTRGKLKDDGDLPFMPADKIIGQLKLSSAKKMVLNDPYIAFVVSNYFKQEKVAPYEITTDGYTLLDVHIGGNFKLFKQRALLSVFGTNILNKAYYNHLSLIKNIGIREMGLNVGFALKVQIGN
jgi:iron complex outermembrane recepter protein